MADATLKEVAEFFGYTNLAEFRVHWAKLTPGDKAQIRTGLGNGTLNY